MPRATSSMEQKCILNFSGLLWCQEIMTHDSPHLPSAASGAHTAMAKKDPESPLTAVESPNQGSDKSTDIFTTDKHKSVLITLQPKDCQMKGRSLKGLSKSRTGDFPGGPAVRASHFHCRGHGFIPGWDTKISLATQHGQKKKINKQTGLCIEFIFSPAAPQIQPGPIQNGLNNCICGQEVQVCLRSTTASACDLGVIILPVSTHTFSLWLERLRFQLHGR